MAKPYSGGYFIGQTGLKIWGVCRAASIILVDAEAAPDLRIPNIVYVLTPDLDVTPIPIQDADLSGIVSY